MPRLLPVGTIALASVMLGACATSGGGYASRPPTAEVAASTQSLPTTADDKVMYLDLIRKMQKQGLYYASLAHIDAYAKRYGTPPSLEILRADALRKTQQPQAAAGIYRLLRKGPQAAAAWHGLGLIAAADGHYGQAVEDLQQATKLSPIDASYLSDLGYARLHAGNIAGARAPLAKAAELTPSSPKAVANLALLLMLEGHPARARDMMDKAGLSDETRQAVNRLATQLRSQYARAEVRAPASPGRDNPVQPTASAASNADATAQTHGISANLLDRFNPNQIVTGGQAHDPQ